MEGNVSVHRLGQGAGGRYRAPTRSSLQQGGAGQGTGGQGDRDIWMKRRKG